MYPELLVFERDIPERNFKENEGYRSISGTHIQITVTVTAVQGCKKGNYVFVGPLKTSRLLQLWENCKMYKN